MNDNDGLLKPLTWPDGQDARVGNRVLFGTDIPDPTFREEVLIEDYEIDDTLSDITGFPASHILTWCVIMLMLALALYSIVW